MEDRAIGVVAAVVLAMIAFRRVRGVLSPQARRAAASRTGRAAGPPARRGLTAAFIGTRVVLGLAALGAIFWLAGRLFP
jgi:hypothetical protein